MTVVLAYNRTVASFPLLLCSLLNLLSLWGSRLGSAGTPNFAIRHATGGKGMWLELVPLTRYPRNRDLFSRCVQQGRLSSPP
jgi:hypothetical protein